MASKTESENSTETTPSSPKNIYKDPDDGRQRFLLELEFVQCLANPTYIHYLAQNRYFEDEAFIGYLKYLQYWQRPEYIKFIMYPHCLYFLELLQNANFRNAMAHPSNKELAHRQQFYFWKNYRNNRLKHILPRSLPEPSAPPAPPAPTSTDSIIYSSSFTNAICWSRLSDMNVARYDFACAEVNGLVYAVGGYGANGDSLSSAEVYDPNTNKWTLIKSLRRPRWGCFA
ncbi:Mediator complex, subunit Med31 [Sesbania bispinosa]|nr:Mediator complex, subunit Med31 [Sesbania bispinosa]